MALYTLGRHKKTLSNAQTLDFTEIYSRYMISSYSDLVRRYKGEQTKVVAVRPIDSNEFIVNTKILKQSSDQSVRVDYLVRKIGANLDQFKVSDIVTEGVSMINSQQAEFNSVINSSGIDGLILELKNKSK